MRMPYHGGQLRAVAGRFGVAAEELLDFSANINPDGPPDGVRQALRQAVEEDAALTSYPDLEETVLREAIACELGLKAGAAEAVFVGNGFVPLLRAAVEALGVRRCLLPVPCFNEYRRAMELSGVAVVPFALLAADGFAYDGKAMLEAADAGGCDAVLLANPQNPSGVLCGKASMTRLIERAAELGIRVLLDEAFIDYSPGDSVAVWAAAENLVVFRSVTKFFALAGLRVAYGVAGGLVAARVRERIAPWSITTLASVGVAAALKDKAYAVEARRLNSARREVLGAALASLGVWVFAGRANFLLVQVEQPIAGSAALWERMIVRQGVVLRDCSEYEGLGEGFYRVAVRGERENERLVDALRLELDRTG